jgi:sugar phosphate isomerase/epimerase
MTARFPAELLALLQAVHVSLPWKHLPRRLETILEYRMNLELGFAASDLDRTTRSQVERVGRRLREAGCRITVHAPFWDLAAGSLDPKVRQISRFRLHQLFDLVEPLNPIHVVCHTGFDPNHHHGHVKFWVEKSLETWGPLVDRARQLNVLLLLENVWEHDPALHRQLFKRLRSPFLGWCLDVGHQHAFGRSSTLQWLKALAPFLRELHLHDNAGLQDHHLAIGQGTFDFRTLFGYLAKKGLNPVLTLEPHRDADLVPSLQALSQMWQPWPGPRRLDAKQSREE